MNINQIILKKRHNYELSNQEIAYVVSGFANDEIPDYQMSSLLMAIVLNGMTMQETVALTTAMIASGDSIDLSKIQGRKVDKHSTGGVGDKTTLVLVPLVAACGVKVAKMSGRGLGHTGGTLDKMESIPNIKVQVSIPKFIQQVNEIGLAVIGQTENLVPADKKMYALRDVTGTVDSIPLIAASIMSKKLATGSDCILLDVKYGSGAFFEDVQEAHRLAQTMVAIGKQFGKDTKAILTSMNQPLGHAIGNALELKEVISTLQGQGPEDLVQLCVEAGAIMLLQAGLNLTNAQAKELIIQKLNDGSALEKLKQMVEWQGGDVAVIDDPNKLPTAKYVIPLRSENTGYLTSINAHYLGEATMLLGAGRKKKGDVIDYSTGIVIEKKQGEKVEKGDVLAWIHANSKEFENDLSTLYRAFEITNEPKEAEPLIYEVIT